MRPLDLAVATNSNNKNLLAILEGLVPLQAPEPSVFVAEMVVVWREWYSSESDWKPFSVNTPAKAQMDQTREKAAVRYEPLVSLYNFR